MKSTKRSFKDLSAAEQQQQREEGRKKREGDRFVRDSKKAAEIENLAGEMDKLNVADDGVTVFKL
jgi:hypothetical protein